jgi:hypothetical protein
VAFETNCRINPVPLVVTLTNAGAIWFQGGWLDVTRTVRGAPAIDGALRRLEDARRVSLVGGSGIRCTCICVQRSCGDHQSIGSIISPMM